MEQQPSNLFELQLDPQINSYLKETARWGTFLSIVGFVMCALMVVVALFAGSIFSSMSTMAGPAGMGAFAGIGGTIITVVYLCMALLFFFPCLYIYNFSVKMKRALASQDQAALTTSFKNLKSSFRFWGILMIIILGFYALAFVGIIVGNFMTAA